MDEKAKDEDESQVFFTKGDLLWTKVGKYPFWPCMVSYDPLKGDYFRKVKVRGKVLPIYHVQYFGESVQHGWTTPTNSFEFTGKDDYYKKWGDEETELKDNKAALKMLKAKYNVPPAAFKKWSVAVREATEALQIPNLDERFNTFVHIYEKKKHGKQKKAVLNGEKVQLKSSVSNGGEVQKKSSLSNGGEVQKKSSLSNGEKSHPKLSVSNGEKIQQRSSVSNGEEVQRKNSVINGVTAKSKSSVSNDVKAKRKSSVSNGVKAKRKSSVSNGTSGHNNGTSDTFDDSAHCSKRIRVSNKSSDICDVCYQNNTDVSCSGVCGKLFHTRCIGIINRPENFKCDKCSSEMSSGQSSLHSCNICHKSNGSLKKCSNSKCSKYYHTSCLEQCECANKEKFICPLHTCITCYRENPRNQMSNKGSMVQCLYCPTAFHNRESCVAAGSVHTPSGSIICPYHFIGKHSLKTCNMNHCSVCSEGGELICCEACPNALHKKCLETAVPSEDFLCEDCTNRRYLLYGMVVWAKLGKFRWWPAQIIHPSDLPWNVKKLKHHDGEFTVQFFGTHDYCWTHSGRVFQYVEDHKKYTTNQTSGLFKKFNAGLKEAADAFDKHQQSRVSDSMLDKKPEAYKHIQVNRALPPAQIITDLSNISTCACNPSQENPCGPESQCLNRSMLMECHPDICVAKNMCQNQKFQKRLYVPTKIFKTRDRGWGLQANQDVKKGEFIIEYVGEIITHEEYRRRSGDMLANGNFNYYFLYLDSRRMIDAGPMGNHSRFINHSCNPNCEMRKWSVNGDARIGIFALVDIPAGDELTFNYQSDKYEFEQKCVCSSDNCRGFIGRTTNNHLKATLASKASTSKTPSKKRRNKASLNSKKFSSLASLNSNKNSGLAFLKSKKNSSSDSLNSKKCSRFALSIVSGSSSSTNSDSSSTTSNSSSTPSNSSSTPCNSSSTPCNSSSTPASSMSTSIPLARSSIFNSSTRELLSRLSTECFKCKRTTGERLISCDRKECLKTFHQRCLNKHDIPLVSEKEQHLSCMTHMYTNTYKSDTKLKRILQPAIQIWNMKRRKKK